MSGQLAVVPMPEDSKTPEQVLQEALARVSDMGQVLIIYGSADGTSFRSMDNDLSFGDCLLLVELFKQANVNQLLGG